MQPEGRPKILLRAERDVAVSSPDHILPWGTVRDNSRNPRFNQRLYELFGSRKLRVLDLGCSGGGFVKDCLDDGCLAVGLEGSDSSKRARRAEWATIPENLFTCDITADFTLLEDAGGAPAPIRFDVVTMWEVMEHIADADVPTVAANVKKHLRPGGLWIMSVSPNEEVIEGIRLHQTVQPKRWWVERFAALELTHLEDHTRHFGSEFVRGPRYGAPGSFHLVLCPTPLEAPRVPPSSWTRRLADWVIARMPAFTRLRRAGRAIGQVLPGSSPEAAPKA